MNNNHTVYVRLLHRVGKTVKRDRAFRSVRRKHDYIHIHAGDFEVAFSGKRPA